MKPRIRATATSVVLAHSLQHPVIKVYDARHISVLVREDRVSGYGYMSHRCVSGDLPNLYPQGERSHFVLMADTQVRTAL